MKDKGDKVFVVDISDLTTTSTLRGGKLFELTNVARQQAYQQKEVTTTSFKFGGP